jgi:hypothetical protein
MDSPKLCWNGPGYTEAVDRVIDKQDCLEGWEKLYGRPLSIQELNDINSNTLRFIKNISVLL